MQKQVNKLHYEFGKYVLKPRWPSLWHQLDEVIKLTPKRVLEVGPGPGLFKAMGCALGIHIETLDLDPELKPDHVASVFAMPFNNCEFDVVCAFQMLEHLPFEKSLEAFREMVRVANVGIIISLPDAAIRWPFSIYIPKIGSIKFSIPKPRLRAPEHQFDGEHYWEINKASFPLSRIMKEFTDCAPVVLLSTYRVTEYPYHRFFIFKTQKR